MNRMATYLSEVTALTHGDIHPIQSSYAIQLLLEEASETLTRTDYARLLRCLATTYSEAGAA